MCGAQRGLLLLLQGQIWAAIVQFPPFVAWTLSATALCVCEIKRKIPQKTTNVLLWGNLIVLLLNAIYQNLQG